MIKRKVTRKTVKKSTVPKKRGRPSKKDIEARLEEQRLALLETNETPTERIARIAERFTVMYRLTQGSINGAVRSLIVSGAPGTGKSHTIVHLLDQAADREQVRYEIIHGALTAVNLYKLMYRYRGPNDIIMLDDADTIYEDEDAMNILKGALDSTEIRKINWLAESATLKSEGIPTTFVYEGAMIFITNKDFQGIVDVGHRKMAPHFAALMSRSIYLDLKLHTPADLLAWTVHMVTKNHILVQRGLDYSQENDAVEWIQKHVDQVREISIRTLLKIADFIKTDPTNWEVFAKVTILR